MAERLDERHDIRPVPRRAIAAPRVEDRDRDAQVGQVADAALGRVDVVVEVHVAGPHRLEREVAHHRVDQRAVAAPGQFPQPPVVDACAKVVGVADHRRARGPRDGLLDLGLDRRQRALDELDRDGVDV
jgi:hypothetical protein